MTGWKCGLDLTGGDRHLEVALELSAFADRHLHVVFETRQTAAAVRLGVLQRDVDAPHDRGRIGGVVLAAETSESDAGMDLQRRRAVVDRPADLVLQLLGEDLGAVGIVDGRQHVEFVGADTGDEITVFDRHGQTIGDLDQHLIADDVAADVVEHLEAIDVEREDGAAGALGRHRGDAARQFRLQSLAIGKTGETVEHAQRLGRFFRRRSRLLGLRQLGAPPRRIGEAADPQREPTGERHRPVGRLHRLDHLDEMPEDAPLKVGGEQHREDRREDGFLDLRPRSRSRSRASTLQEFHHRTLSARRPESVTSSANPKAEDRLRDLRRSFRFWKCSETRRRSADLVDAEFTLRRRRRRKRRGDGGRWRSAAGRRARRGDRRRAIAPPPRG